MMVERADELSQAMSKDRRALPDVIKKVLDDRLSEIGITGLGGANNVPQIPSCQSLLDSKEERYLPARRSLRVWPLENASPESLTKFASKFLQMTPEEMACLDVVSIRNCRKLPHMKIQQEYSVEFASVANCDSFRSYAPRLHQFRRTAGMRLMLPDFLSLRLWSMRRFLSFKGCREPRETSSSMMTKCRFIWMFLCRRKRNGSR